MDGNYWQTRTERRRLLKGTVVGAAGVSAAAFLAACGSDNQGGTTSTGTGGGTSSSSQAAATPGTPKKGGVLTTWSTTPPDNPGLDNIVNFSGEMSQYASYIYPKLTRFKMGSDISPVQFTPELDLASAVEQVDPTTYAFKIPETAKWQDVPPLNGRQMTAEDVAFNVKYFLEKATNKLLLGPHVDKVEAVDKSTVQFKLNKPLAPFMTYVGHPVGPFIYPPEFRENDQTRDKTAASGPFILDKYEVGSAVHFKRNPNYFKPGLPHLDGLTVSVLREPSTIVANIRSGALDINTWTTSAVPWQFADDLKRATPGAKWVKSEFPNVLGFCFDLGDPRFKDERVRQAFSIALARDNFPAVLGPAEKYTGTLTIYEPWWLDPQKDPEISPYYKRDVQRAKQLLSAAGFPDGMKNVEYPYNAQSSATNQDLAALIQSNLKEAGIEIFLTPMQNTEWFQTGFIGKAPNKFYFGAGIFNTDPSEALALAYHPDSPRNPITNKQVIKDDTRLLGLMDKIQSELDPNKRKGPVDEVQRYLAQKAYILGSVTPVGNYYASKRTKNMNWVMGYGFGSNIAEAWIE
jgi:ABC-type transport system substrate-binding protein